MTEAARFRRILKAGTLVAALLSGSGALVGQQQPPVVTHPSSSSVQVSPHQGTSPYGNAANAATGVKLPAGSITGFVYWQMNVFQPQSDCQGLSVKIITVNNSGMPLQLLSTTSALTASGPLTDYSAMGAPKYMLCSYSFHNMPEKTSLRALLYGMPTSVSVAIPAAFQIPGGNCSSTPSGTLSFILSGGPMLCGDGAYNINFKLTAPASSIERSPGHSTLVPNAGGPPHGLLAQPHNPSANSDAGSVAGKPTLLSAGPGTSSPTSTQAAQQEKPGQVVAAGPTRQATTGTNSSGALTNADVTRMLKAGLAESVIISSIRSAKKNFDFSPAGCRALQRARVSPGILAAMGDGGERPCGDVTRIRSADTVNGYWTQK